MAHGRCMACMLTLGPVLSHVYPLFVSLYNTLRITSYSFDRVLTVAAQLALRPRPPPRALGRGGPYMCMYTCCTCTYAMPRYHVTKYFGTWNTKYVSNKTDTTSTWLW